MQELASLYRSAQFYAHNSHNFSSGLSSLADHKFFKEAYEAYTDAYDDLIERMIGLGIKFDILAITKSAAESVSSHGEYNNDEECFKWLLELEKIICVIIKKEVEFATDGTQNLLQGLADESEKRQYKIQQRLKS